MDKNGNTFRNKLVGAGDGHGHGLRRRRRRRGDATRDAQVSSQYDASIDSTIADIQAFWATAMPDVYGQPYEAIPTGPRLRVLGVEPAAELRGRRPDPRRRTRRSPATRSTAATATSSPTTSRGCCPSCATTSVSSRSVSSSRTRSATRCRRAVGYDPPATVYFEQQADCFAGAWAQHVADSDDENVHLASSDLDTALAGLLTLSDPSGIDGAQDGRARQRLRPGQRVPGRVRGWRGGVRRLRERPALGHRGRVHELPGPGDAAATSRSTR